MDYKKVHDKIIERAKARSSPLDQYREKHHILKMKHRDYFKIVDHITSDISLGAGDCLLDYLFRNRPASHCDVGNYHIQKNRLTSTSIELGIIINPRFHSESVSGFYRSISGFYRSILVLEHKDGNSFIDPLTSGGYRSDFVVTFPNRTESEDNYLKLRAGTYYKDVFLLYDRLYQEIETEIRNESD